MKKRILSVLILICILLTLCPVSMAQTTTSLPAFREDTDGSFFYPFSHDRDWTKKLSIANSSFASFEASDGINQSGMLSIKPYAGMGAIGTGVDAVTMQAGENLVVSGRIRYRNAQNLVNSQMYVQVYLTGLAGLPLYADSACTESAGTAEGGFVTMKAQTDTEGGAFSDGAWHSFSITIPTKGAKHSKGSYIDLSGKSVNIWFRPYAGNSFSATTTYFQQSYLDECTTNGTTPYADILLDDFEGYFCTDEGTLSYHETTESLYHPYDSADSADTKAFLAKSANMGYLETYDSASGVVTVKNNAGSVITPVWNRTVSPGKQLRVSGDITLLNGSDLNADNINVNALLILNGGSSNNPAGFYEDEACTIPAESVNGNAICHQATLSDGIAPNGWTHFSYDFDTTTVYKSSIKRRSTDSAKTTVYIKPWEVATVAVWFRVADGVASNATIRISEDVFTAEYLTACGYKKESNKWVADTDKTQTTPYIFYGLDSISIRNVTEGAVLPGDFKVESVTLSKTDNLSVGDTVNVSYRVTEGFPENGTRTYLYADNVKVSGGRTENGFSVPVTKDLYGKSLKLTITPKSGTVFSAQTYEIPLGIVGGQQKNLTLTSPEKYTVTYSFDAVGDVPESSLYLAFYGKNGQLLSVTETPVASQTATGVIAADTVKDETAYSAKLMLLDKNLSPLVDYAETDILRHSVFLIGDSICVSYKNTDYPQEGWGSYMQNHFTNGVQIENRAVGGRSTSTYMSLGNLDGVLNELEKDDYVFINLAINDDAADDRYTSEEQYEENITYYVQSIKAKGATPILVTPHQVARMNWISKQDVRSSVMKRVAQSENIPLLDLNTEIRNRWYGGAEDITQTEMDEAFSVYYLSKTAFAHIEEAYGRTISQTKWDAIADETDHIHINFIGATELADMICDLLKTSDCDLKTYLK